MASMDFELYELIICEMNEKGLDLSPVNAKAKAGWQICSWNDSSFLMGFPRKSPNEDFVKHIRKQFADEVAQEQKKASKQSTIPDADETPEEKQHETAPTTIIKSLTEGDKSVTVIGTISDELKRRKAGDSDLMEGTIADQSGTIKLGVWAEKIDEIEAGEYYQLDGTYVTAYKGVLQLNVSKYSRVHKLK